MDIKKFYLKTYPTDELGLELNERASFTGLLKHLYEGNNVYAYFGVSDSLVRERLFEELSNQLQISYDYVYDLWMKGE